MEPVFPLPPQHQPVSLKAVLGFLVTPCANRRPGETAEMATSETGNTLLFVLGNRRYYESLGLSPGGFVFFQRIGQHIGLGWIDRSSRLRSLRICRFICVGRRPGQIPRQRRRRIGRGGRRPGQRGDRWPDASNRLRGRPSTAQDPVGLGIPGPARRLRRTHHPHRRFHRLFHEDDAGMDRWYSVMRRRCQLSRKISFPAQRNRKPLFPGFGNQTMANNGPPGAGPVLTGIGNHGHLPNSLTATKNSPVNC